jgi:hypothetical protein
MAISDQMKSRTTRVLNILESITEARGAAGWSPEEAERRRQARFAKKEERAKKGKAERAAKKAAAETEKKEKTDDELAAKIKPKLTKRKSRAKTPELADIYKGKTGKPLRGAAGLEKMRARRKAGELGSGREAERAGGSVHDKIAALHKTVSDLKGIVQRVHDHVRPGGEAAGKAAALKRVGKGLEREGLRIRAKDVEARRPRTIKRPGVTPGRRDRPQEGVPRGELPSEFRKRQAQRAKELDWLEKERQRRSGIVGKAGKLARMRGKHRLLRDPEHDVAKGYDADEPRTTGKKGYHVDDKGKEVHATGKKSNKKFANATTFRDSDDDAMLHTDKSKEGSRASAGADEFVFKGDTKKDPRQKWYRVSKEGGYASAMASLGKSYHKSPDMRSKVISKVKSTGFVDSKGKQINVKPTGAQHDERGACVRNKKGRLTQLGQELKRRDPGEFYRLCKGAHGESGTKAGRSEYERGFDPRHDDAHKVRSLHKAAEAGKAEKPERGIAMHLAAKPGRRADIKGAVRSIGRKATRTKWRLRPGR